MCVGDSIPELTSWSRGRSVSMVPSFLPAAPNSGSGAFGGSGSESRARVVWTLTAILWKTLSVPDLNKRQSHLLLWVYFSCLIQNS